MFDLHADLKRTNELLERIACALESIVVPVIEEFEKGEREFKRTEAHMIGRVDMKGERAFQTRLKRMMEEG